MYLSEKKNERRKISDQQISIIELYTYNLWMNVCNEQMGIQKCIIHFGRKIDRSAEKTTTAWQQIH